MKLYIVRHGETDWNKKRRIQGQVDIPLNDFGRSLARKTAKGLSGIPFEVCYTSPLGRAKETARLILEGRKTPILEDQRIIEMSLEIMRANAAQRATGNCRRSFGGSLMILCTMKPLAAGKIL